MSPQSDVDSTPNVTETLLAEFGISRPLILQWTVVSIVGFLISLVGFLGLYYFVTGDAAATEFNLAPGTGWWNIALTFLFIFGAALFIIIPHELCHGLAIRAFGGTPRYGFGVAYLIFPYAFATTDTRFSRNQFLVVALAPLVVLTLIGVPIMVVFEWPWLALLLALNAGGAVGDLWMSLVLLSYPATVSVIDSKTGLKIYGAEGLERWTTAPATVVWDLLVGIAGGAVIVAVVGGILTPVALVALGLESLTLGLPDSPFFIFQFVHHADSGVEFSMGSGVFILGGIIGIAYAYLRARQRSKAL